MLWLDPARKAGCGAWASAATSSRVSERVWCQVNLRGYLCPVGEIGQGSWMGLVITRTLGSQKFSLSLVQGPFPMAPDSIFLYILALGYCFEHVSCQVLVPSGFDLGRTNRSGRHDQNLIGKVVGVSCAEILHEFRNCSSSDITENEKAW